MNSIKDYEDILSVGIDALEEIANSKAFPIHGYMRLVTDAYDLREIANNGLEDMDKLNDDWYWDTRTVPHGKQWIAPSPPMVKQTVMVRKRILLVIDALKEIVKTKKVFFFFTVGIHTNDAIVSIAKRTLKLLSKYNK